MKEKEDKKQERISQELSKTKNKVIDIEKENM